MTPAVVIGPAILLALLGGILWVSGISLGRRRRPISGAAWLTGIGVFITIPSGIVVVFAFILFVLLGSPTS